MFYNKINFTTAQKIKIRQVYWRLRLIYWNKSNSIYIHAQMYMHKQYICIYVILTLAH
jgi:hypothetical protein